MTPFLTISAVLVAGVLAFLLWGRTLSKKTLIGLLVSVPTAALVLYCFTGTPQAITVPKIASTEQSNSEHNLVEMEQLVGKLARRLEETPEDIEGWILLARSYAALGHTSEAQAAFARVTELERKAQKPENASAEQISGIVSLSPHLKKQISPSDTVFIFAKAPDGTKPPLAAIRLLAKDLPAHFVLDDTLAMLPDRKLSLFSEVIIEARITKTGNPSAAPDDLEGSLSGIKVGSKNIELVINRKIPG